MQGKQFNVIIAQIASYVKSSLIKKHGSSICYGKVNAVAVNKENDRMCKRTGFEFIQLFLRCFLHICFW